MSYARQIGLNAADKVLFIADGAPWIWRRLQRLIAALGLSPTQVLGLIDFYTALRELCRGRTAGKIRTHLNYFLKNRHRFAYTTMVGLGLPRGSGAVESAIRRVINLRIKAHPSIGYRRASTRFFSCGLSISPADGTVCSGWP